MSEFILETKNLGISFGGLKAAQDVNLKIKKNQIYGLIGPNGAGKTTIFNMLTGVYKPTTSLLLAHSDLPVLRLWSAQNIPRGSIQHILQKKSFQYLQILVALPDFHDESRPPS